MEDIQITIIYQDGDEKTMFISGEAGPERVDIDPKRIKK